MRDTLEKPLTEPGEGPARFFHKRRTVRWIAILAIGIVMIIAFWQEPLYARF
jgi:hypothetical protein